MAGSPGPTGGVYSATLDPVAGFRGKGDEGKGGEKAKGQKYCRKEQERTRKGRGRDVLLGPS